MPRARTDISGVFSRVSTSTFNFSVDGIQIGHFSEVSGLGISVEVEDIVEGGQNGFVHRVPGRTTWTNITLKRGLVDNNGLVEWLGEVSGEGFAAAGNKFTRKTAVVTLVQGIDVLRAWNIEGAFPVRWTGPTFAATGSDMATEELEIAHQGFTVVRPG